MYQFEYYMEDNLLCKVYVGNIISIEIIDKSIPAVFLPFGIKTDNITMQDLDDFYESRCFPKERGNCRELLKALDVDYYEPELICRKTHGLQYDDMCWIKFDTDRKDLSFKDINCFV